MMTASWPAAHRRPLRPSTVVSVTCVGFKPYSTAVEVKQAKVTFIEALLKKVSAYELGDPSTRPEKPKVRMGPMHSAAERDRVEAARLARAITRVEGVWFLEEFGSAEAMWVLQVQGFEAVVAIDAHGESLYDVVRADSEARLAELL